MVTSRKGTESEPLLAGNEAQSGPSKSAARSSISPPRRRKDTPLPWLQLLVLAFVRLAEPVSYTQIFPYVNQMIEHLGIAAPADVGYYSGMVDSSFAFAQLLTIYFWSSLSDRIGRKPVIMIGVTGATLSSACFGFSQSLPAMLISRSLAGALSGNVAVVSSMLSEMTDETNQGKAFPLMGATWNIGCVIGPMLGGHLSNPMRKWPALIKHFPIFESYPYLLPCITSSTFSVIAIIMCGIFVEETLPSIVAAKKAAAERKKFESSFSYDASVPPTPSTVGPSTPFSPRSGAATPSTVAADNDVPVSSEPPKAKLWDLLSKPHIRAVLASAFMFSFLGVGFDVVFVLLSYTRIDLGGLSRSPVQIGTALAGSGTAGAIISLLVFPWFQHRFNNRKLYTALTIFWPITIAMMPIAHLAAKLGQKMGPKEADLIGWAGIVLVLLPVRIAANVYPLSLIIIKSSVENSAQLGSMFGLQQSFSSIARGIAPTFVSSLFAFSVEHRQILGGNLVWVVLVIIASVAVPISTRVRDVKAVSATIEDEEEGLFEASPAVGVGLEGGHGDSTNNHVLRAEGSRE